MITYNHEKYIRKAIESVICQKTDFRFEIVISDDASTDNTSAVIRSYQEKHPEMIKPVYNKVNKGATLNAIETMQRCTGKYMAVLEGDDYWSDKNKLQKQFDLMEAHPDLAFCYTNASSFSNDDESDLQTVIKSKPSEQKFDLDYYIGNHCFFIPTLTMFVRRNAFPDPVPYWLYQAFSLDWTLCTLYLTKGMAAYIDCNTACYRQQVGISSSTPYSQIMKNGIQLAKNLDKHFNYKYHHVFGDNLWRHKNICIYYFQKKKFMRGIYWFFSCFFYNPYRTFKDVYFLKTLYKVTFQGLEAF